MEQNPNTIPQKLMGFLGLGHKATGLAQAIVEDRADAFKEASAYFTAFGGLGVDTVAERFKAQDSTMSDTDTVINAYAVWLMASAREDEVDKFDLGLYVQSLTTIRKMLGQRAEMDTVLAGKGGLTTKLHQLAIKAGVKKERAKREVTLESEAKLVDAHQVKELTLIQQLFIDGDMHAVVRAAVLVHKQQQHLNAMQRFINAAQAELRAELESNVPATPDFVLTNDEQTESISA
jgi:hypothetical protein